VLVHAGATHLLDEWLDAVREGGRLLVPLTGTMPGMGPTIGKGGTLMARRNADQWSVTPGAMVAIYSLVGLRDETRERQVGQAFLDGKWAAIKRIRRDVHDPDDGCILHGITNCISS
jgi:protein-L-isoaspartate(D-aspartate) O-methyltransferase